MVAYLVVEGKSDAVFMQNLLQAAEINEVEIMDAGGKSSAMSLGNSIAVLRQAPVAILVDADTDDDRTLKQQRDIFYDLQRNTSPNIQCRLFLAVPTLEKDVFKNYRDFEDLYNTKLNKNQKGVFDTDRSKFFKKHVTNIPRHSSLKTYSINKDAVSKYERNPGVLKDLFSFLRDPNQYAVNHQRRPHRSI